MNLEEIMRRLILSILALVLVAGIFSPATLRANEINVTVDGVAVDFEGQPPAIVSGRTLVPVRGVFEHLGFDVEWEQDTQTATLSREARIEIIITIGSDTFTTNGMEIPLDVPAQIIGGRTMLPIRAVVESVGYGVGWEQSVETVAITTYVTIGDMRHNRSVDALFLGDSDLTDEDIVELVYMTRLNFLHMQGNQISDLTPLSELTNLVLINLGDNLVQDISPLAGLTNMRWLYLNGNNISDITPLASLADLMMVDLSSNPITDWSPVEHVEEIHGKP